MSTKSVLTGTIFLCIAIMLSSCGDIRQLVYFNENVQNVYTGTASPTEPAIQNNDLLSITVSSLNPEASAIFNAPNISAADISANTAIGTSAPIGYLVNQDGAINFPMLGEIKVMGIKRRGLCRTYP